MKIFCDFDGTAAKNDVGNLLFKTFADDRCFEIVQRWKEGKISSKECLTQECKITRITRTELEEFSDAQELDPYFVELVSYCQARNVEVEILSDGLDFYIDRILKKYELDRKVNIHSNRMQFRNGNRIEPEFPYYKYGCGQCANCKGYHVQQAQVNPAVYIGDGLSDRCGARKADVVFAKQGRDLLRYCQTEKVEYFEFADFSDVLEQIRKMSARR